MSFRREDRDHKEKAQRQPEPTRLESLTENFPLGFMPAKMGTFSSYTIHIVIKEKTHQIIRGRTQDYRIPCVADETTQG